MAGALRTLSRPARAAVIASLVALVVAGTGAGAAGRLASTASRAPGPASTARPAASSPSRAVTVAARRLGAKRRKASPWPPPLERASPAHPITILEVGDSLGEDLGIGLSALLAGDRSVHLLPEAVGSTGLAALWYYDWPVELASELDRYHPQLVIVMLGGNDAQSFDVGSEYVGFGTPLWRRVYGERVATMMREATSAGAHVLWVGMPIMSPTSVLSNSSMQLENEVYSSEARQHPGVAFMSTWRLFANAEGQYAEYLPDAKGQLVQVRDPDGVHIDIPGGTDLVAGAVLRELDRLWHLGI